MRDEIDAHALGTHQADDLFNLVNQGLGGVLEQHVGFIEEEHQLRQFEVTDFGQLFIELAQQPQQEGGIELGIEHQLVGSQHIHHTATAFGLEEVQGIERRLTEEELTTFGLQSQQGALDGTHAHRRHRSVGRSELFGVLCHIVEHHPQVLHVDKHQPLVIGNLEDDVEDARLSLVEVEQTGQQLRTHLRDGGTEGVTLFAIHVEETCGAAVEVGVLDAKFGAALLDEAAHLSRLADAREVAFHIGHEARHTSLAEGFGKHLKGDGLTRTRGTCNHAVTVGHLTNHVDGTVVAMCDVELFVFCIHSNSFIC